MPYLILYLNRNPESPIFLPGKVINLGLDLKGGSYLLLKADMDVVFIEKLQNLMSDLRVSFRKNKIAYNNLKIFDNRIVFKKRNLDTDKVIRDLILKTNKNLLITKENNLFQIEFSKTEKDKIV